MAVTLAARLRRAISPPMLDALVNALKILPRNRALWAYTIQGVDGSPYITRAFGPRLGRRRRILHRIHRPDADRAPHSHPWKWARFVVVSGGYLERRLVRGRWTERRLSVGDVNILTPEDFHLLVEVSPDTWTLGEVGERWKDWGFRVEGEGFVHHDDYFARIRFRPEGMRL